MNSTSNIPRLQVRQISGFAFGTFTYATDGTVTIDARGTCRTTGGAVLIRAECSPAVLELRGQPGEQVELIYQSQVPLKSGNPGGVLMMENFTTDRSGPIILGSDGSARVRVGATLTGRGRNGPGNYSGAFPVRVTVLR